MMTIVDEKNKTLQEYITNNVNATIKDFQSTLIKNVNTIISEQLEIIYINIVNKIQEAMIQIQKSQVIATQNNISQDITPLKNTQ